MGRCFFVLRQAHGAVFVFYHCEPGNSSVPCFEKNVVAVTRPFPRGGSMVEDHGAPESGQLRKA